MNWWEVIKLIIKWGPTAYKLVREILDLIEEMKADKPDVAAFYARRLEVARVAVKAEGTKAPLKILASDIRGALHGAKQPI
jgi:hypothetical protein